METEPEPDNSSEKPVSESSSEESNPERHEGTECAYCEMCPIVGPRFKCTTCEDVSLCRSCYKRRLEVHTPRHRFFAMKPMLGVEADATEKLKEKKRLREKQNQDANQFQRMAGIPGVQPGILPYGYHGAMGNGEQWLHATQGIQMAASYLPIHFAPPVQPTDAPEVASKLQERWQNIGQEYKILDCNRRTQWYCRIL